MYPPGFMLIRLATESFKTPDGCLTIEKGVRLMVPVFSIHRDADNFPEPDVFQPERFSEENRNNIKPFTYLPFGEGPRNCIGIVDKF